MAGMMINYWAVLGAAVASFVIGMLWYGPLFGKQWMKLAGITPASMKKMKMTPARAMTFGFIATLVTAYVLSNFVNVLGIMTWTAAAQFAFWAWLGLVAPVQFGAYLWEGKPLKLFVLNTAHNLVVLIVMSGIVAVWA
jgi:hypothetical protein